MQSKKDRNTNATAMARCWENEEFENTVSAGRATTFAERLHLADFSSPRLWQSRKATLGILGSLNCICLIIYHLARFDHLFIFLDDDDDAALEVLKQAGSRVTVVLRGDAKSLHPSCPSFAKLGSLNEISARQILNAEACVNLCLDRWTDCWLVHVDADELFYTEQPNGVSEHFRMLDELGVEQCIYTNYEAVVDSFDRDNYFEQTLFKKHHLQAPLTAKARHCLQFWFERTTFQQYFLFYDNGKAGVKCRRHLRALSQHCWADCKTKTTMIDPRKLDLDACLDLPEPLILHFPVGGFAWFRMKYKHLGHFPMQWLGSVAIPSSIHTMARGLSPEKLEDLFRREVLVNPEDLQLQLDAGLIIRLNVLDADTSPKLDDEPMATMPSSGESNALVGIEKGWIIANCVQKFL